VGTSVSKWVLVVAPGPRPGSGRRAGTRPARWSPSTRSIDVARSDLRQKGGAVRNAHALLPAAREHRHDEQLDHDQHDEPGEMVRAKTDRPAPWRRDARPSGPGSTRHPRGWRWSSAWWSGGRRACPSLGSGSPVGSGGSCRSLMLEQQAKRVRGERASATPALRRTGNYGCM
jgi:hypothetical protein